MGIIGRTTASGGPEYHLTPIPPSRGQDAFDSDVRMAPGEKGKRKRSPDPVIPGRMPLGAASFVTNETAARPAPETSLEPKRRRGETSSQALAPSSKILWPAVAHLFEPDVTLGDVEVLGTTRNDWRNVLVALENTDLSVQLFLDHHPVTAFAHDFDALFERDDQREWHYMLAVDLAGNKLHAHFFEEATIAFDFDWHDVFDQDGLDALLHFMALLHKVTNKKVQIGYGLFVCDERSGGQPKGPFVFQG